MALRTPEGLTSKQNPYHSRVLENGKANVLPSAAHNATVVALMVC